MTIYERIKFLRKQQGMSQQTLAEKVGFKTASAVNKIELGLRDINQTKIILFAKALNTTPAYLIDLEQAKLGDRIKALRKTAKLNQTELAEALNKKYGLNIDRVMISKWETGFQIPILKNIICLSDFFDVSVDYLLSIIIE